MERRGFLQTLGVAGLGCLLTGRLSPARAGAGEDPLWVCVQVEGGWDPTAFCDPHPEPHNNYTTEQVYAAGTLAPFAVGPYLGDATGRAMWESFFERHGEDLLVLNGVDMATNSHPVGVRYSWSGLASPGAPSFAAFAAAAVDPALPMAYLANGGYEETRGAVAGARISEPDSVQALRMLATPQQVLPEDPDALFMEPGVSAVLRRASQERLLRLASSPGQLPGDVAQRSLLHTVRGGQGALSAFFPQLERLPPLEGRIRSYQGLTVAPSALQDQVKIALAAFGAGLAVSADLHLNGFDTHADHEAVHYPMLAHLFDVIAHLFEYADRLGLRERLNVVVGSDFGRTAGLNPGGGKDHHPIGSYLFMGPAFEAARASGAVLGRTRAASPGVRALGLDPSSLESMETGGVVVTPAHVHAALRARLRAQLGDPERQARMDELDQRFRLAGVQSLPLFEGR